MPDSESLTPSAWGTTALPPSPSANRSRARSPHSAVASERFAEGPGGRPVTPSTIPRFNQQCAVCYLSLQHFVALGAPKIAVVNVLPLRKPWPTTRKMHGLRRSVLRFFVPPFKPVP